ncbi:hypothetical protein [Antrihabitans stalactiti]|uniref:Uncharacterized protein n=1 Tax=Antrihabitans stalactiti TaxID=2584121 RepID=A0A848KH05_9NOCA|nr:hypothetical protein [Antrihabitans stalactiti]NMN98303.1 hypothetical protein [Antrihabitans stalactiti]
MDVAAKVFRQLRQRAEPSPTPGPEIPIHHDSGSSNTAAARGIAVIAATSSATVAVATLAVTQSTFAAAAIGVLGGAGVILAALMIGSGT